MEEKIKEEEEKHDKDRDNNVFPSSLMRTGV